MNKYLIITLLILPLYLKAQKVTVIKNPTGSFSGKAIEVEPQFPGGSKAFYNYITNNVEYAPGINAKDLQGRMVVTIAIDKDGSISDVKIVKGITDVIDRETVRIISISPKWKPGTLHGIPIKVRYTFSINYVLTQSRKA